MKKETKDPCDNCFAFVKAGIALCFHAGQITLEEFHKLMDEERCKDLERAAQACQRRNQSPIEP